MIQRFESLAIFLIVSMMMMSHSLYGFSPIITINLRTSTQRRYPMYTSKPNTYASFQKLHVMNKNESDPTSQQESSSSSSSLPTLNNNNNKDKNKLESLSFDEAQQAIREEEDQSRMEARGLDMDQDTARMEANKSNFDRMRQQIRSRAQDLKVTKSVATVQAIQQATARAMNPTDTPTLDLSKIGGDFLDTSDEDDLPEDVKRELDKVGQLSFWDQAMEEFKNTRFPSPDATLKQAILMIVIFAVTATIILKVDEWLRILYTSWGFIPKSGEIIDFSNLALPEGFTDQMTEVDVSKM